jgi:DNA-binding CsgD family transcriptional regulator
VIDRLCSDLRTFGRIEHRLERRRRPALTVEQRELLALLADGLSLGDAAQRLHLSRRTADRRLAAARATLGASTTAEAVHAFAQLSA